MEKLSKPIVRVYAVRDTGTTMRLLFMDIHVTRLHRPCEFSGSRLKIHLFSPSFPDVRYDCEVTYFIIGHHSRFYYELTYLLTDSQQSFRFQTSATICESLTSIVGFYLFAERVVMLLTRLACLESLRSTIMLSALHLEQLDLRH